MFIKVTDQQLTLHILILAGHGGSERGDDAYGVFVDQRPGAGGGEHQTIWGYARHACLHVKEEAELSGVRYEYTYICSSFPGQGIPVWLPSDFSNKVLKVTLYRKSRVGE